MLGECRLVTEVQGDRKSRERVLGREMLGDRRGRIGVTGETSGGWGLGTESIGKKWGPGG